MTMAAITDAEVVWRRVHISRRRFTPRAPTQHDGTKRAANVKATHSKNQEKKITDSLGIDNDWRLRQQQWSDRKTTRIVTSIRSLTMTAAVPQLRTIFVMSEYTALLRLSNKREGEKCENSKSNKSRRQWQQQYQVRVRIFVTTENRVCMAALTETICTLWEWIQKKRHTRRSWVPKLTCTTNIQTSNLYDWSNCCEKDN